MVQQQSLITNNFKNVQCCLVAEYFGRFKTELLLNSAGCFQAESHLLSRSDYSELQIGLYFSKRWNMQYAASAFCLKATSNTWMIFICCLIDVNDMVVCRPPFLWYCPIPQNVHTHNEQQSCMWNSEFSLRSDHEHFGMIEHHLAGNCAFLQGHIEHLNDLYLLVNWWYGWLVGLPPSPTVWSTEALVTITIHRELHVQFWIQSAKWT